MHEIAVIGAILVMLVNALAALTGLAQYLLGTPTRAFWVAARGGQVVAAVYLIVVAGLAIFGWRPNDNLFWIYALVPPAVGYFAEQLRVVAARTVLERNGYETVAELRAEVESDAQRASLAETIAFQIRLREMGIVSIACGVVAFLAWRAWITA